MDIARLKNIGQMQSTWSFVCSIPYIPFLGVNDFEFLVRSTSVPAKTRNKTIIRYLGQQFNLPGAVEHDGEWTADIIMSETHQLFDLLIKWNDLINERGVGATINDLKTEIKIKMFANNKDVVNKRFRLTGCYPGGYPEISDLNQDNTEGFIINSFVFHIDDIDFDPDNVLTF